MKLQKLHLGRREVYEVQYNIELTNKYQTSMSNFKPMLFSTDMVRAILDGTKTQTRRIIKPQPNNYTVKSIIDRCNFKNGNWCF